MADDLRDKIEMERLRIRTAAGNGILDLTAVERLKALMRDLEMLEAAGTGEASAQKVQTAEQESPKGEVG